MKNTVTCDKCKQEWLPRSQDDKHVCTTTEASSVQVDRVVSCQPASSVSMVSDLLAEAKLHNDRVAGLLRAAADRIDCLEISAADIVKGNKTKNMKLIERGLKGFQILLGS